MVTSLNQSLNSRSVDFDYRQFIGKICLKALRLFAVLLSVFVLLDKAAFMSPFNIYVRPTINYASKYEAQLVLRALLEHTQSCFTCRLFG